METLTAKKNGKATRKDAASIRTATSATKQLAGKEKVKPNGEEKPEVLAPSKAEVKPVETPEKPVQTVEPVKPVEPPKPQLSLEQKIEKIENLKTLIEKREKLEASRKKLTSFVVGTNQFNENIVLTDEHGNTFKTSNSEVFAKVVEAINSTLVEKISEIEQQIEF
ncbi:MAG: hypothetical protein C0594_04475 [Marinilabiliales bacterium]|nr:MAG: hypothetical protein C0594_04475 [Marinilabiliales bacterium]